MLCQSTAAYLFSETALRQVERGVSYGEGFAGGVSYGEPPGCGGTFGGAFGEFGGRCLTTGEDGDSRFGPSWTLSHPAMAEPSRTMAAIVFIISNKTLPRLRATRIQQFTSQYRGRTKP